MADYIDDLIFAGWYSHCPKQRRLDRSEFCVDFEERDAIGAKSKDWQRRLGDLGMNGLTSSKAIEVAGMLHTIP